MFLGSNKERFVGDGGRVRQVLVNLLTGPLEVAPGTVLTLEPWWVAGNSELTLLQVQQVLGMGLLVSPTGAPERSEFLKSLTA